MFCSNLFHFFKSPVLADEANCMVDLGCFALPGAELLYKMGKKDIPVNFLKYMTKHAMSGFK